MPPVVEPTLAYLENLRSQGHVLTDFHVSCFGVGKYLVTVHAQGGLTFKFQIFTEREVFTDHHKKAVEFTGFGPVGLANILYADARRFSNNSNIVPEQIEVMLSEECLTRVGEQLRMWNHYGFVFVVSKSLQGISYQIRPLPVAQE